VRPPLTTVANGFVDTWQQHTVGVRTIGTTGNSTGADAHPVVRASAPVSPTSIHR
jgi:hypothetical protein